MREIVKNVATVERERERESYTLIIEKKKIK